MGKKTKSQEYNEVQQSLNEQEAIILRIISQRKDDLTYYINVIEKNTTFFNTESVKGKDLVLVFKNLLNFLENDIKQWMQKMLLDKGFKNGESVDIMPNGHLVKTNKNEGAHQ